MYKSIIQKVLVLGCLLAIFGNASRLLSDIPLPSPGKGQETLSGLLKKNNQTYHQTVIRLPDTSPEFFLALQSLYGNHNLVIHDPDIFLPNFLQAKIGGRLLLQDEGQTAPQVNLDDLIPYVITRFIYNPKIYAVPTDKFDSSKYPILILLVDPKIVPFDSDFEVHEVRVGEFVYFFPVGI